jgi:hypothetical protein
MNKITTYPLFLVLLIGSLLTSCKSKQQELQQAIQKDPLQATQQIGWKMQQVAGNEAALNQFIKETAPNGKEIVEKLASNTQSYTEFFPRCDEFTELDMAVLVNHPQFKGMKRLAISSTGIDQVSCKILSFHMSQLKDLQFLFLDDHRIGDSGIELLAPHLEALTKLEFLILTKNNITDKGLQALAPFLSQLKLLRHFYLDNNLITDKGMEYFAPHLKDLKNLSMLKLGNNTIGDPGIQALIHHFPKLPMLFTLDLSNNQISTTVKNQLKGKLKELGMGACNLYVD